jgi:hypothetical protein
MSPNRRGQRDIHGGRDAGAIFKGRYRTAVGFAHRSVSERGRLLAAGALRWGLRPAFRVRARPAVGRIAAPPRCRNGRFAVAVGRRSGIGMRGDAAGPEERQRAAAAVDGRRCPLRDGTDTLVCPYRCGNAGGVRRSAVRSLPLCQARRSPLRAVAGCGASGVRRAHVETRSAAAAVNRRRWPQPPASAVLRGACERH